MTAQSGRTPTMPGHDVELCGAGMRIRNTPLFLDALRATELSFISHAHSDHIARHKQAIGTAATLQLVAHRLGQLKGPLPVPYRQPFTLGSLTLELLPAGHVLGSAQLRVTRGDRRITYTGDFNPVPGLTAEAAEVAHCDLLVIESTFGHPRYRFPPREETAAAMCTFARRCLEDGQVPVFLAYSLGKSQEGMRVLADAGFRLAAHSSIAEVCAVYQRLGCAIPHRRFEGRIEPGEVLFFPPNLARSPQLERLGPHRTAVLTGWALDSSAKYRYGADEAFPLSDHADFEGLVGYVEATGARRVVTVHGFAKEFAACLRDRGIDARPLEAPPQLEMF